MTLLVSQGDVCNKAVPKWRKLVADKIKIIPQSVMEVLKHPWRPTHGYSAFDSVFNRDNRKTDPSYYNIRPGKQVDTDFDVLSHQEAAALVKDAVFGQLAIMADNCAVGINEHAQHAFVADSEGSRPSIPRYCRSSIEQNRYAVVISG
jgi:hypothetical protein